MKVFELFEGYREGRSSTFTHDGKEYPLDPFFKVAESIREKKLPISKLDWVIKYSSPERYRVERADTSVPVLVVNDPKHGYVVFDGLHRLIKAKEEGKTSIGVKEIPSYWFERIGEVS